ncbi:MAG: DUF1385 domain-containing protein [Bryobacterales bacterium]|nr:DUF1385 domain-containing protein [Bryobacterales bacterium]
MRSNSLVIRTFFRLFTHIQLMLALESGEETLVGGQAVMEGVMMRAPHSYCVAVRKKDGEIITTETPLPRLSEKYPVLGWPILRGVATLGHAMTLGVKALKFSADVALHEEARLEAERKGEAFKGEGKHPAGTVPGWLMAANLAFSLVFFLFLYKFVPLVLTEWLAKYAPSVENQIVFNAVDGIIRLLIFCGFLFAISRTADIRRVFEFHGAEHKVVFNYESGQPVTVENAQRFSTFHPRCGTSFLLVVMLVSIGVYTLFPVHGFVEKFLLRLATLPLIAGLSYELIRFSAKRQKSLLALMVAPGLWLQRITTQPPSDDQAEVAIRALDRAMMLEIEQGGEAVIA